MARIIPRRPPIAAPAPVVAGAGTVNAVGGLTLEQDWVNRSTGAGVVWAERFNNASTWNRWVFGDTEGSTSRIADDGIMGDGCFQHLCTPSILPDGGFARPLKPVNGNGSTVPNDINNPGLYHDGTTVVNTADAVDVYSNGRGGFFGHSSYHNNPNWDNTTLHPAHYKAYIGTDYYVQFRVKFSPGRFTVGETDGKIAMAHLIYNTTPRSEIVVHARTNFGGRWFNMYTGAGTPHLLVADYPDSDDGTSIQPGGPKEATCLFGIGNSAGDPNFCWLWPEDEWLTVLMHIIPGTVAADYNNPVEHRNTGIEVWVASESRIAALGSNAYELIHRKLDYALMQDPQPYSGGFFPDQYGSNPRTVNGFGQPPGASIFALNAFNGGASLRPSVQPGGWWHRYDQIIMSTQFIPCPAVAMGSPAPQWVLDLPNQTWTSICLGSGGSAFQNGATLISCEPTLSAGSAACATSGTDFAKIISAWTGGVGDNDRKELRLNCNGGHGDYVGNGCFALQLNRVVPRWIRQTDPTPASFFNGSDAALCTTGSSAAQYNDGRPRSAHTANTMCYGGGYDWQMGQSAYAAIGHSAMHAWRFDRAGLGDTFPVAHNGGAGPWQYLGAGPTGTLYQGFNSAAWDSTSQKAWGVFGENSVKGYFSADMSGTVTNYTQDIPAAHFGSQWSCVDKARNRLIQSDYNSQNVYRMNLANPNGGFTLQSCTGGSANRLHQGAVYHAASDAILTFDVASNAPGTINKLNLSSFVWSTVALGGSAPTNQFGDDAGTNSKFQLFEFAECSLLVCVSGTGAGFTKVCKLNGAV